MPMVLHIDFYTESKRLQPQRAKASAFWSYAPLTLRAKRSQSWHVRSLGVDWFPTLISQEVLTSSEVVGPESSALRILCQIPKSTTLLAGLMSLEQSSSPTSSITTVSDCDIVEKDSSDMSSYISSSLRRRPRLFQHLSSGSYVLVLALPSYLAVITLNPDSDIFSNHWKYTEQTVDTK